MNKFYALFVGIDAYQKVSSLNGCVNDALMMFEYLQEHLDPSTVEFYPEFLLSVHDNRLTDCSKRFEDYGIAYSVNGTTQLPTRKNMLDRLKSYAQKLKPGDRFFFFYAGHGSTEAAHPYFKEPTGSLQTLVPCDARTGEGKNRVKDLLDKEIRYLIRKIEEAGTDEDPIDIIIVQDSCHSAGATRTAIDQNIAQISAVLFNNKTKDSTVNASNDDPYEEEEIEEADIEAADFEDLNALQEEKVTAPIVNEPLVAARMLPADPTLKGQYRLAAEMDCFEDEALEAMRSFEQEDAVVLDDSNVDHRSNSETAKSRGTSSSKKLPFDVAYPEGNHLHLSACGKTEFAYEIKYPSGQKGGVFTNTIIALLKQSKGNIAYHDLFNQAKLKIDGEYKQSPSLYVKGHPSKRYQRFLGGVVKKQDPGLCNLIYKARQSQWQIDFGAFLGLAILRQGESIPVKVFQPQHPEKRLNARIDYVLAERAILVFDGEEPQKEELGWKVKVPPNYLSNPMAVEVEDLASYEITNWLDSALKVEKEKASYHITAWKGNYRIHPNSRPQDEVEIACYQLQLNKPKEQKNVLDFISLAKQQKKVNSSMGQELLSGFSTAELSKIPQHIYQLIFSDGSCIYINGRGQQLEIKAGLNLRPFLLAEPKSTQSLLNALLLGVGAEQKVFFETNANYPNPFLAVIEAPKASFMQSYVQWNGLKSSYKIRVWKGRYYIVDAQQPEQLISRGTAHLSVESAYKVFKSLKIMSRWHMLYRLQNPHPGVKSLLETYTFKLFYKLKDSLHVLKLRTLNKAPFYQWVNQQGQVVEALELDYLKSEGGFEMEYMSSMVLRQESEASAAPLFQSTLFMGYDYSVVPKTALGSTEFLAYHPQTAKNTQLTIDIGELKVEPPIFNARTMPHHAKTVQCAYKFFIAYKRFDPSDWVQEGIELPSTEDYENQLHAMRSVLSRKKGDGAGDHVVLTLPVILKARENSRPKPLDDHSNSIRGGVN